MFVCACTCARRKVTFLEIILDNCFLRPHRRASVIISTNNNQRSQHQLARHGYVNPIIANACHRTVTSTQSLLRVSQPTPKLPQNAPIVAHVRACHDDTLLSTSRWPAGRRARTFARSSTTADEINYISTLHPTQPEPTPHLFSCSCRPTSQNHIVVGATGYTQAYRFILSGAVRSLLVYYVAILLRCLRSEENVRVRIKNWQPMERFA